MPSYRPDVARYPLNPSQFEEVGRLLLQQQLDPNEFKRSAAYSEGMRGRPGYEGATVDQLTHEPTGYFFLFDFDAEMRHIAYFRPGKETPETYVKSGHWGQQREYVKAWLSYVKREHETPDWWAQRGEQRELGAPPSGVGNTPFTTEERTRMGAIFHAALESAPGKDALTEEQDRALETKIDQVLEATERLTRLDWRSFFVGAMVEVMVTEAVPPGLVRHVVEFVLRGVFQLVGPDFSELPRPGG